MTLEANSFYIETYGCTSNKADSLIISNILKKANYIETSLEKAEFIIFNTCAVKEQTENKIKARLKKIYETFGKNLNKFIVIAGCLPHIAPEYIDVVKKIVPTFSAIVDLDRVNDISEIFREIKEGKKNLIFNTENSIDKSEFLINYPPGKITGIVPISEGCQGSCTYCCVKNARGKLNCYNPHTILKNVNHQLSQGIKQIYLTSQDCSIYEYNNIKLYDLVKMINILDFKFFLRMGMINPSFLINYLEDLISIFKLEKVYKFLHIPVQSGSNKILKKMQRPYLISEIIDQIEALKRKFPDLTISTDIICGFPGETEYDFHRTVNFVKWLNPEILNISKFTGRPGTKAKKMKHLDSRIIKERSIRLSRVFRNSLLTINEKWDGWEGEVLVIHKGEKKHQAFGRNFAYKNIFINDYNGDYGKFVKVKINKVDGFNLFGKLIKKQN
ncbi:MAG: tRNA (N(6)-L-threonylcarbamoyladenosine(37)-C(2))-methylthiotransferase [Candidatus Hodarchaeota archaeon]